MREAGRALKEKDEGKSGVIGVASDDEESGDSGEED